MLYKYIFFYGVFDHKRTVSSLDADAIKVPKGLIAIQFIEFLCPINLNGRVFGLKFHTNIFPSSLPDIACSLLFIIYIYIIFYFTYWD